MGGRVSLRARPRRWDGRSAVASLATVVDPLRLWPRATRLAGAAAGVTADAAARAGLVLLARVLDSPRAADALDVLLRSALAERAVRAVIEGPLVEVAARGAPGERLVERAAGGLLETGAVDRIVDRAIATPLPRHVADQLL